MRVVHPKNHNSLIMVEGSDFIAEVDTGATIETPDYRNVIIGHVGYSASLSIYKDEWDGFVALVKQIDLEFRHDMGAIRESKP